MTVITDHLSLEISIGNPFSLSGIYKEDGVAVDISSNIYSLVIYDGHLTTDTVIATLDTGGGALQDSSDEILPQVLVAATAVTAAFDGTGAIEATGAGFTGAAVGDVVVLRGGPNDGTYFISSITDDDNIVVTSNLSVAAAAGTVEVHKLGGFTASLDSVATAALSAVTCATWRLQDSLGNKLASGDMEIHSRVK